MRKRNWLVLLICLFASATAYSATNFQVGVATNDFAVSVGHYDYLPYYGAYPASIRYYDALSDYGNWVSVSPFGSCWHPYIVSSWQPYVYGHWTTTNYGQTWVGYEPWAWMVYPYGHWVWTAAYGWVWIPGYDYSPARVVWGYTDYQIGWMPAPPYGYDYSLGYLAYRGPSANFYFTSGHDSLFGNLWVFVDRDRYFYDNYAGSLVSTDTARRLFQRRAVRLSTRPLGRDTIERITGRRVRVVPVRERTLTADGRRLKTVVPAGEETRIRKNARTVVSRTIEPAFKDRKIAMKGSRQNMAEIRNQRVQKEKTIREEKLKTNRGKPERQEKVRAKTKITSPQKSTLHQRGKTVKTVERSKSSTVRKNQERQKTVKSKAKITGPHKTTLTQKGKSSKKTTYTRKEPYRSKKSTVVHGKARNPSSSGRTRERMITKSKHSSMHDTRSSMHGMRSMMRESPRNMTRMTSRKPTRENFQMGRSTQQSISRKPAYGKQPKKQHKPH